MQCFDPNDDDKPTFMQAKGIRWYDIVIAAIAILIVWSLLSSKASSHEWYDIQCCSGNDCRAISGVSDAGVPWTEIEDAGDRYIWHSSKSGKTHEFLKSSESVKPSRDGFYHGCELPFTNRPMCLYVPLLF